MSEDTASRTVTSDGSPATRVIQEDEVLERIHGHGKAELKEDRVTMAHGAGGKASGALVGSVFASEFSNPMLDQMEDQARFEVAGASMAFTTDSYVVNPLFFPGGDIGDLAVNGTVNDLAMSGARPLYLSVGFIMEEGFPITDLRKVAASISEAARAADVHIVTGDTKVVQKGKADGCYINTAGIGVLDRPVRPSADQVQPGDAVLVSGPIGDHGITIMLSRGDLDLEADSESDTAPLAGLVGNLLDAVPDGVRCMRDATRGGVGTVLNEIATASDVAIVLDEQDVPVRTPVRGACEVLGIDPLYVACEGRMVAIVDQEHADAAVTAMRSHPLGADTSVIGTVKDDPPALVMLRTDFGGTRIVDTLVGDPLPRIC